ncbi:MAG: porin family protein [Myxococcota bacterium]|nr:porin family protein [Myxococcota bacterium]
MKRAALAVILLAASSGVASAGGYIGLGVGTGPSLDAGTGEMDSVGRSGRLVLGSRLSRLSIEGALTGFDMQWSNTGKTDVYQGSVSAKLNLPLGDGFEPYGRLGVQRTWLSTEDERYDMAGNGLVFGAGIEYRFSAGIGAASLWLDYQYSNTELDSDYGDFDLSARMWTVGISIGI